MTGLELHQRLIEKWGRSYDVQLRRTQGKIVVQIMWKYLEQASFPLSPEEYETRLDEVGSYLEALGAVAQLEAAIATAKHRPRIGKAISIPLTLELGDRASEWMLD
ncbi:MAG: DUF3067 family protein [Synechococcales cyanobacterium RM1_1_8]|nr:DUF3067 family protein [Synechococcales cyanobacterium RM1_1_8]